MIPIRVLALFILCLTACAPTSTSPPAGITGRGAAGGGAGVAPTAGSGGGAGTTPATPSGGIGGGLTSSAGASGVSGGGANAAGAGGSAAPTYAPTFKAIFSEIFPKYSCNLGACHAGTSMKVTSDAASTYMNIINATASGADQPGLPGCGATGKKLIVPNNTNDSLLLLKVKPSPPCGARMRLGGPPYLDDREIDQITQWIQMGAPDN